MANHLYGSNWTDERIETLKKLYADGCSMAIIAGELGGLTRNAVIGKVHRLKLTRDIPKAQKICRVYSRAPIAPRYQSPKIKPPSLPVASEPVDVEPLHISIALLTSKTCRWPYGDGPFTFCGHDVSKGPYCPAHTLTATGNGTPSERSAARDLRRAA